MASGISIVTENEIDRASKAFFENLSTKSRVDELDADVLKSDWCDEIISRLHYLDNIFNNPKRFLEVEELILDIEKAKKADVDSVKHLSKHSDFISEFDEERDMVIPKKIMNSIKEDTFDLYENRFAYSLVLLIEDLIFRFETYNDDKKTNVKERFFYSGDSKVDDEDIECRITMASRTSYDKTTGMPPRIKQKIETIKNSLSVWQHSAMYVDLKRRRVPMVQNPIKRTNTILKNPNFQQAIQLWDYLYNYSVGTRNNETGESTDLLNEETTKIINNSLLVYYLVMKRMNTNSTVDSKNYTSELKKASIDMINNSTAMLMALDQNFTRDDMVDTAVQAYDNVKKEKGADASVISDKIRETVKEYIDKVNNSFFSFSEEGLVMDDGEKKDEPKKDKTDELKDDFEKEFENDELLKEMKEAELKDIEVVDRTVDEELLDEFNGEENQTEESPKEEIELEEEEIELPKVKTEQIKDVQVKGKKVDDELLDKLEGDEK